VSESFSSAVPRPSLWSDIRAAAPRSFLVAAVVGTILVLVNQGDRLADMTPGLALRCFVTYLTPFVVSMIGWLSATRWRKV
jgi:hypothetical protein